MNLNSMPGLTMFFVGTILVLVIWFHRKYDEKAVHFGPTILTTTGIFATFVGIAVGLLDFNANNIQASVPALIGGLKTAFWGSVIGVGGALSLKFRQLLFGNPVAPATEDAPKDGVTAEHLAQLLKAIQQALVGQDDSTLITQMKLARQENNDRLDALKKAQVEALEKLSELGSKALIEALKDVIRDFNDKLTEQFGENFKALNQAVGELVTWQNQYKAHIEKVEETNATIAAAMKESSDSYKKLVGDAEAFTNVSRDLSGLLTALDEQRTELRQSLEMLSKLVASAATGLPQIEEKILQITQQLSTAVTQNQTELSKALTENANLVRTSIESSTKDIGKVNSDFAAEIAAMVAKTKEQVTVLDTALAEELTKSLEGLGRQLAALSEKFVSDYSPLTDRLRDLVKVAERAQ
ncbi:hypothetical protein [Asticcacaulis solisilvae]|uniref:hypothetical protein n=1 Tax=Asticcacaulis solisilvae TaxID=1217274 RepID=UPI003FD864E6